MFLFLIPLVSGFFFNLASAFTAAFTRRWGGRAGSTISIILRDVLGIPLWGLGFLLAARAASAPIFETGLATQITGWLLIAAGALLIIVALSAIRARALAPSTGDPLIQQGIYAHLRHPIHAGTLLEFAGLFLLGPSLTVAIACLAGAGWLLIQSRFEEIDLIQRMPGYPEYMRRVPRFIPHLPKR